MYGGIVDIGDSGPNDRPRLLPVVLAVLAVPALYVAARLVWPPGSGRGTVERQLVVEFALVIITLGIVAWARWWRQAGLVGPWRQPLWLLLLAGLLLVLTPFDFQGLYLLGHPARLPTAIPLVAMIGFSEETLTRGVMLYGLSRFGPLVAGLATAGIFGVLHVLGLFTGLPVSFLVVQMITAALLGILFAALRFRMVTVWPVIVTHAALDAPALLMGYPLDVEPVTLVQALVAIGLLIPFASAGLGLLLWDQLTGNDPWRAGGLAGPS